MIPRCSDPLQEEAMLKILQAAEVEIQRRRLNDHRTGSITGEAANKLPGRKFGERKEEDGNA